MAAVRPQQTGVPLARLATIFMTETLAPLVATPQRALEGMARTRRDSTAVAVAVAVAATAAAAAAAVVAQAQA